MTKSLLIIERYQSFAAIHWGLGPLLQAANSATVIVFDTRMSKAIYTKLWEIAIHSHPNLNGSLSKLLFELPGISAFTLHKMLKMPLLIHIVIPVCLC